MLHFSTNSCLVNHYAINVMVCTVHLVKDLLVQSSHEPFAIRHLLVEIDWDNDSHKVHYI